MKSRTLSEMLIDADKATQIVELSELWEEIIANKYSFSLVEIRFAYEHVEAAAGRIGREDAREMVALLKKYLDE